MMTQELFFAKVLDPSRTVVVLGLERVQKILHVLGNPERKYPVIHIAGTNGKGSTATFIEYGLICAGFLVGKFSSPHIYKINESILLNNNPISDQELLDAFRVIEDAVTLHHLELTQFEYLTVIMFYFFALKDIDYLVLEAGVGGRFDATNVVNSLFAIITNIGLEHTNWSGSTLKDIAYHKAGIIKNGKVIIADNGCELIEAVKKNSHNYVNVLEKYQPVINLDFDNFLTKVKLANEIFCLNLFGAFQVKNFLCAYEVLTSLNIPINVIQQSTRMVRHFGRLERINKNPTIILDATHNVMGACCLYETLHNFVDRWNVVIVTSILKDKDITKMLSYFDKLADTIVYTSINANNRAMKAEDIADIAKKVLPNSARYVVLDPKEAVQYAQKLGKEVIIVTGSIYLLGSIGHLVPKIEEVLN